jgi:F-type H+-transporting ATPase subunit gamma
MASLREIRRKIKSVKSTQQITKAMKMVSAARMRRAQAAILSARPFAVKMEQTVRDLALAEGSAEAGAKPDYPLFKRGAGPAVGLVLVTADKGLCGAFNANLIREAVRFLREHEGHTVYLAVVGKKGNDFFRRLKGLPVEKKAELVGIFPKVHFAHAEIVGKAMLEAYIEKGLSSVTVIYNEFKSVAAQKVVRTELLPIEGPTGEAAKLRLSDEFLFEPGRHQLLEALLPRFVKAQLYRMLLESQAAELAARMNAMDAASKNAGELIGAMTLHLNRTRQALITREIAELVGGAEALAQ